MEREPPFLVQPAVLDSGSGRHLLDNLADPFDLSRLQRRIKHEPLKVVQFVGRQEAVLVGVDEAKDSRERRDARRFQSVLARVVQGGGWVEDGVLGKEKDFRDVERQEGRAFDAGLQEMDVSRWGRYSGSCLPSRLTSTSLNSCMIGTISVCAGA